MTMAGGFTAEEYFKAQQQRTRTIGFLYDIFRDVAIALSLLVTKQIKCVYGWLIKLYFQNFSSLANGITAPEIMTDAESHGESDATLTARTSLQARI